MKSLSINVVVVVVKVNTVPGDNENAGPIHAGPLLCRLSGMLA